MLGGIVLIFFQLSYNRVIETPVSHPITPAVVNISDPFLELDSTHKATDKKDIESHSHTVKENTVKKK